MQRFRVFMEALSLKTAKLFYNGRQNWSNFWEQKTLVKKALFTLAAISIFIIAGTITAPFVSILDGRNISSLPFFNILNLVGGGGLRRFSIMALGINPFITASLIMTILQSKLFPPIYRMAQSGPVGRRKINIITRVLTLFVAYPQAIVLTQTLSRPNGFISFAPGQGTILNTYIFLPLILMAGSLFALFLAEQITEKGIGNGTSLLIFSGIVASLPAQFQGAWNVLVGTSATTFVTGLITFLIYLFSYLLVLLIMTIVYLAERRVPIQQTGAGLSRNLQEMGSLPIKVNPAGILPVIFANIVLSFPLLIAGLLDPNTSLARNIIETNLSLTSPVGFSLLLIITFIFSIFLGIQQSKIDKISEDFSKNGTFIPGLRPGEQTEDYLLDVVLRLSTASAFYLTIVVGMRYAMIMAGVDQQIAFGGTGMMILVSVALETLGQIQARRKSSHLSQSKRHATRELQTTKNAKAGILW